MATTLGLAVPAIVNLIEATGELHDCVDQAEHNHGQPSHDSIERKSPHAGESSHGPGAAAKTRPSTHTLLQRNS